MEQVAKKKWKDLPLKDRILLISQMIVSLSVVVVASLQLVVKSEVAHNIMMPLMGIMMILMGLNALNLKLNIGNKILAYFCFAVAIFMFIVELDLIFF